MDNKIMKIFTQKVNNCSKCNFFDKEFTECNYTDEIFKHFDNKGEEIFWEYEDIHKTCPFNKSLTKEDIESFGFKYLAKDDENRQTYIKSNIYLLYKDNIVQIFKDLSTNFQILLDECTITSKPHLKFILQTLNIII